MKILDRYILKEISGYALLALLVFTFVLTIPEMLRLSELFARQGVPPATWLKLCLAILPGKLVWTLPMAVLIGLLVGWSRLAADGEIVALQASALGFSRLLWPSTVFAVAGAALALATTLVWGPQAAREFRALQEELAAGGVSYEVQPRVFDERFPNLILYVQDVDSSAARWRGILLADVTRPAEPRLTLAETGIVVNEPQQRRLQLHLRNATAHEVVPGQPERYSVSTFAATDLSLPWPQPRVTPVELRRNAERTLGELWAASQTGERWRSFRADFHRRLALPFSCLVFALVAVPLGMARGHWGRAGGVVLAFLLFVGYYIVFVFTDRFAREAVLPPWLGVWGANLTLTLLGVGLLAQSRRPPRGSSWGYALQQLFARPAAAHPVAADTNNAIHPRLRRSGLPRLLDLYVVRGILFHFAVLLATFLVLFALFNLLDLIDDMAKHQVRWPVVAHYLWYLWPQALYWMVPLSALLAVLIELGLLSKRNELVAIKAAGISLFRIATPVLGLGLLFSLGLFLLDYYYLPYANQRQEALRNQIKGRPPQTVFQPQRKWIFGQQRRLFNYQLFDSRQNLFGGLTVLELLPDRFALSRRLYAQRAHWEPGLGAWVFENGWQREFDDDRPTAYRSFTVASFPEVVEEPGYFKKDILESAQMNFHELGRYIAELRQGGFEVSRLKVHWHKKFGFPLTVPVMILIGFPFGLRVGRRGALGGLAIGIALGLSYWVVSSLFEALGNIQLLPPLLAGWGSNLVFAFAGLYWLLQVRT